MAECMHAATALFILGANMVGKLGGLTSRGLVLPMLLIIGEDADAARGPGEGGGGGREGGRLAQGGDGADTVVFTARVFAGKIIIIPLVTKATLSFLGTSEDVAELGKARERWLCVCGACVGSGHDAY